MKRLLFTVAVMSTMFAPEPFDASVPASEIAKLDSEYVLSAIASRRLTFQLEELNGFCYLTVRKFGPNPGALTARLYNAEALGVKQLSIRRDPWRGMHRRVNREERQFPRVDHGQLTAQQVHALIDYIASEGLTLRINVMQRSEDGKSWGQGEPFTRSGLTQTDIFSMLMNLFFSSSEILSPDGKILQDVLDMVDTRQLSDINLYKSPNGEMRLTLMKFVSNTRKHDQDVLGIQFQDIKFMDPEITSRIRPGNHMEFKTREQVQELLSSMRHAIVSQVYFGNTATHKKHVMDYRQLTHDATLNYVLNIIREAQPYYTLANRNNPMSYLHELTQKTHHDFKSVSGENIRLSIGLNREGGLVIMRQYPEANPPQNFVMSCNFDHVGQLPPFPECTDPLDVLCSRGLKITKRICFYITPGGARDSGNLPCALSKECSKDELIEYIASKKPYFSAEQAEGVHL